MMIYHPKNRLTKFPAQKRRLTTSDYKYLQCVYSQTLQNPYQIISFLSFLAVFDENITQIGEYTRSNLRLPSICFGPETLSVGFLDSLSSLYYGENTAGPYKRRKSNKLVDNFFL